MIVTLLSVVGYVLASIGACLTYIYHDTNFDQTRFDKWKYNHLRRFPDAEREEAEEYNRTHQGAFIGQWLQDKYMKELRLGKKVGLALVIIGGFLAIIPNVL